MKVDDAFLNLKHAFESGRFAHAYIVAGAPREEGRELAEKVIKLLFCSAKNKPCGECNGCRLVGQHTHPDVVWVESQLKSRKISIEQIRNLQHQVYQTSFSGGWKACVFVGADRIGEEAANAFLKTLEEPPENCVFFLLTDSPQYLLPTVVSRCQSIDVAGGRLGLPDESRKFVVELLSRESLLIGKSRAEKSKVAAFAQAESLIGFLEGIKEDIEKEETAAAAAYNDAWNEKEDEDTIDARVSARYRETRSAIMRSILLWHRDILMLVSGVDKGLVFGDDGLDGLRKKAGSLNSRGALQNIRIVEEMNRQLERNLPEGMVLGFGFSRLN